MRLGVKTLTRASSVPCNTRAGATVFVTHAGATTKLRIKMLKSHLTMAKLHLQNMRRLLGAASRPLAELWANQRLGRPALGE